MRVQRRWKVEPDEVMRQGPVIPVMVIHKLEQAAPLARALMAGGLRVLEITLRTPVAMEAIRAISREVAGAIVGAGTVTRGEELAAVADAGAVFAISPGLTAELLEAANQGPIPLIPGIATVSELMTGMALGYNHFKFFPAEAAGGVKMLRAIAGPFPQVTFCPTGGITSANYREYLALKNVVCIGGSWVAPQEAIGRGDWERIVELTREAVEYSGR
ncbi:MAG: bifunctional 4-hydroxy-2-oxoglutarate aldolase/2-dehydro-3-deoxy-phosphogluconate aldolase [Desulfobacterales bacterium]